MLRRRWATSIEPLASLCSKFLIRNILKKLMLKTIGFASDFDAATDFFATLTDFLLEPTPRSLPLKSRKARVKAPFRNEEGFGERFLNCRIEGATAASPLVSQRSLPPRKGRLEVVAWGREGFPDPLDSIPFRNQSQWLR